MPSDAMDDEDEHLEVASVEELVKALRPLAAKYGKSFARYTLPLDPKSKDKIKDATVNADELVAVAHVSEAMIDCKKPITKIVAKTAMTQILNEFKAAWKIADDMKTSWIEIMSFRLRCIDAKTTEVMRRAKTPAWLLEIPWIAKLKKTLKEPAVVALKEPAAVALKELAAPGLSQQELDNDRMSALDDPVGARLSDKV